MGGELGHVARGYHGGIVGYRRQESHTTRTQHDLGGERSLKY